MLKQRRAEWRVFYLCRFLFHFSGLKNFKLSLFQTKTSAFTYPNFSDALHGIL